MGITQGVNCQLLVMCQKSGFIAMTITDHIVQKKLAWNWSAGGAWKGLKMELESSRLLWAELEE